jgi:GTP-binding protein EngB required for normal cell division
LIASRVLHDHQELRKRAAALVLRLSEMADEDGGSVTHQNRTLPRGTFLREIADKLESNRFVLAVVGEFSRGKSSLINALLDRPTLLPTAIEPSTAAITVISYARELSISVAFQDGTRRDGVDVAELGRYALGHDLDGRQLRAEIGRSAGEVQWEQNRNGSRKGSATTTDPPVQTINIGLPAPFLRDGITLIDTPGIGSVNPEHGEATRSYIHKADAVLFLVNTDPVISESECTFLAFLKDYVQRFLFVVTKIDRFSPREREESVAYTARTIEEYAGLHRPPIYPVSARLAALGRSQADGEKYEASGFPRFLEGLQAFLVNARGKEFLSRHVNLALAQVTNLTNTARMELQGLDGLDELPSRIEGTRQALDFAGHKRTQIVQALEQRLRRIDAAMESFSPTARLRLEMYLTSEVERLVDGYNWEQLQRVSESLPVLIRDMIARRLGPQFQSVAVQLTAARDDLVAACREHLGTINERLNLQFEGLTLPTDLNVALDFNPEDLSARLNRINTFTIGYTLAVTVAGMVALGPLGTLVILGGLIARQTMASALRHEVKAKLKASLAPAVSKLLGSLFNNVRQEVEGNVTRFRQEVLDFLDGATGNIDRTLSRLEEMRPTSEAESNSRRHHLRVRLAELEDMQNELFGLAEPDW